MNPDETTRLHDFTTMSQSEREAIGDSAPVDYTSAVQGKVSQYEFDERLRRTIEIAPTGERWLVAIEGDQLVRTAALPV